MNASQFLIRGRLTAARSFWTGCHRIATLGHWSDRCHIARSTRHRWFPNSGEAGTGSRSRAVGDRVALFSEVRLPRDHRHRCGTPDRPPVGCHPASAQVPISGPPRDLGDHAALVIAGSAPEIRLNRYPTTNSPPSASCVANASQHGISLKSAISSRPRWPEPCADPDIRRWKRSPQWCRFCPRFRGFAGSAP